MTGTAACGRSGFKGASELNAARFGKGMLLIADSVSSDMTTRTADRGAVVDEARIAVDLDRTVTVFRCEVVVEGGTRLVVMAGVALVGAAMA